MDLRNGRMVLYRGSLKSCNYRCSYCPFSKHPRSERELLKDAEQWFKFCGSLADRAAQLHIRAMMAVPYGEALIHPWYWQGLGRLGAMEAMDGVGAQTNLSFSLEKSLELYRGEGGKTGKLRLWATFHPEMTTAEEFAEKCRKLWEEGVAVSAGAVGVPKNTELIKRLRQILPKEIYLWVNKMDGLGRNYTKEETEGFRMADPFFERELELVWAKPEACANRLFVEGDGKLRRCNISRNLAENWYEMPETVFDEPDKGGRERPFKCGKRICSCYLAYGGRSEAMNLILFGPYPLFRIPRKPKAAFLDIDGTLIPRGERNIPGRTVTDLRMLAANGCRLFFATSLPYMEAKRKCADVWHLFEGGIFAGGAHVICQWEGEKKECFFPMDKAELSGFERLKKKYGFRILTYGSERCGGIYKITLVRPKHMGWRDEEAEDLEKEYKKGSEIRCFTEGNCLQIVNGSVNKAEGVKLICRWLGISPWEAAAMGDSREDEEMMQLCSPSDSGAIKMNSVSMDVV